MGDATTRDGGSVAETLVAGVDSAHHEVDSARREAADDRVQRASLNSKLESRAKESSPAAAGAPFFSNSGSGRI